MKNDQYNLKLKPTDILKLCKLDNVKIIPVCFVLNYPKPDEIVYIENDMVHACHIDDLWTKVEISNEVLVPLCIHKSQSEMPYPLEVAQTLHCNNVLNAVFEWVSSEYLSNFINIALSLTDKTYNEDIIASVYFISDIRNINVNDLNTVHDKFIKDNNIPLSYKSANSTHIYLHKQDTINIYDIAKYANYIKLKGFTDNIIHIDLEVRKKSFDVFNIKKEISMFIKYFFGEEVWSQR